MIVWSKPIEAAEGFNRTDAEVLKVRVDGSLIIYWHSGGSDCFGAFPASSSEWRNVPELSDRDRWLLHQGYLANTGPNGVEAWIEENTARILRECPHD